MHQPLMLFSMHFSPIVTTAGWDWFCGRWGNGHDVWTQKTLTKSVQMVCGGTEEIQGQDHQTEAWMLLISVQNYTVANSLQSSESTGDLTLILFLLWKFHSNFQTKERQEIDVILTKKSKRFLDFPGVSVVKTPHSQCRRCGFNPWSRN